jgi:hypothetical protein
VTDNKSLIAPQKPKLLEVDVEGMPTELKASKKWVVWRLEWNGKKWTKKPTNPKNGRDIDHQSDDARMSLGDAFGLYQAGKVDGIGFSLGNAIDAGGLVFIDLDGCINDGEIAQWAKEIIQMFPPCHVEYSPSGNGVHLLVKGKIPRAVKETKNHVGIEIYASGRYFATTGNMVKGAVDEIPEGQRGLDELLKLYGKEETKETIRDENEETDADFEWIEKCMDDGFLDSQLDDYSQWLSVGMALNARFGDPGTELWEKWSNRHEKHITNECYQKVRTFKRKTGKMIQFGSLVKIIRDNGGPEPPKNLTDDRRCKIMMVEGEVEDIANKCLDELVKHPAIYKRNGRLIEVVATPGETYPWRIVDIETSRLASILTGLVWFYRLKNIGDKRSPEWIEVGCNPARVVLEAIIQDPEKEGIRQLNDVATFPYFSPNGKLVSKEGYDNSSGVLKISNSEIEVISPSSEITDYQVKEAVRIIEDCFSIFSFDDAEKLNSIWTAAAGIMTLQARRMMKIRPSLLIVSENRGSGKTQISEQVIRCGTGESRPVPSYLRSGQQLLTDLFSAAGTARNYIYYDNLKDGTTFGDPVLDGIITAGRIQDRVFGKNNVVESRDSGFMILANGNNVAVSDDMVRRCLLIKLKTRETKNYEKSYGDIMKEKAADVAAACMVILAWHINQGCPEPDEKLADDEGFTEWSRIVRNAIYRATKMASDKSEGIDVMKTQATLRKMDSKAEMTDDLLTGLKEYLDGEPRKEFRSIDLAAALATHPVPGHAAKLAGLFAGSRNLSTAIGVALRSRNGHTVQMGDDGVYRLVGTVTHGSKTLWRLEKVDPPKKEDDQPKELYPKDWPVKPPF